MFSPFSIDHGGWCMVWNPVQKGELSISLLRPDPGGIQLERVPVLEGEQTNFPRFSTDSGGIGADNQRSYE